jgi:leucyl aminopeptidase
VKITVATSNIAEFKADAVIVNLFEGVTQPTDATGTIDAALGGVIAEELQKGKAFKGKLGETMVFPAYGKIPARYVILVGLGKADKFKSLQLRRASAAALRACQKLKISTAATILHGAGIGGVDVQTSARLLAEGSLLGGYRFTLRKTKKEQEDEVSDHLQNSVETLTVVESDPQKHSAIEAGVRLGSVIANATNMARDLVYDSSNYVTPSFLAQTAQKFAGGKVTCKVYEKEDIEKFGMGSFLSVGKGSVQPPKLIHLTYLPVGTPRKKVALVGKGITFDSGGLSLKSATGMEMMKTDMTGAAVVISTLKALSELGDLDIQVDAIAPCCENMPSGSANKPGDIVVAMNGKTIEINNTDAEGRLILCDALSYAQKEIQPDELIDLATLTGACVVALGKEASGIMGTDDGLIEGIRKAGDVAGERYWPLPLYDEFKEMLKSPVADLMNAGSKGQAGSSAAGMFLKEFIEEGQKWAHLDIAGPSYTDRDVPEVPKGATGVGVRTLLYYLYGFQETQY